MKKINKISVALCTYQGASFVYEQLDSILKQKENIDEIIISDDLSEDNTLGILEQFNTINIPSIYISVNNENIGYIKNFEKSLTMCKGDIIFLCDQDDIWHKNKTKIIINTFNENKNILLVHTNADLIDSNGLRMNFDLFSALEMKPEEFSSINSGKAFDVLSLRNVVTGATTAIRRELLEYATPFPINWVHDEWLAIIASIMGDIKCIETPLIGYRQHANNQIGIKKRTIFEKMFTKKNTKKQFLNKMTLRLNDLISHINNKNLPISNDKMLSIIERLDHFTIRSNLSNNGILSRCHKIYNEYKSGRYFKYSSGYKSIISDIFK